MWDSRIDDISLFAVRDIKGSEVINVCKKMSRSSLTRRACVVWRLRRLAGAWLSSVVRAGRPSRVRGMDGHKACGSNSANHIQPCHSLPLIGLDFAR